MVCFLILAMMDDGGDPSDMFVVVGLFHASRYDKSCLILSQVMVVVFMCFPEIHFLTPNHFPAHYTTLGHELQGRGDCSVWYTEGRICPQPWRLRTLGKGRKDRPVLQYKWHIPLIQVDPNELISFNRTFTFCSCVGLDTNCNVSLSGEWTAVHNYKFLFSTLRANQSKAVNL